MMREYRWSLLKTLEFLNSRRPDLEIRATFIKQLSEFESRLRLRGLSFQTSKWDEVSEDNKFLESDELMLRNTFINAQSGPMVKLGVGSMMPNPTRARAIKWRDSIYESHKPGTVKARMSGRLQLAVMTESRYDLLN